MCTTHATDMRMSGLWPCGGAIGIVLNFESLVRKQGETTHTVFKLASGMGENFEERLGNRSTTHVSSVDLVIGFEMRGLRSRFCIGT